MCSVECKCESGAEYVHVCVRVYVWREVCVCVCVCVEWSAECE